ncbi:N-acetyltransferase family protein [Dactylosporangium sp. CA-052675]|uniref:GNAT family N-acetyltransferase n=1 Tax=Dactylosporangium sp. CA-052675 TaxID=3239927 RepID=UPI003D93EF25
MIRVRPATDADDAFLRAVHAASRDEEVARFGWDPGRTAALLAMQFDAQRRHFRSAWPRAVDGVVEAAGEPVGRLYLDRGPAAFTVLDVALLAGARGTGIGTALLRGLQAEAAALGRAIELRVVSGNPARRLYERLGFRPDARDAGGGPRLALRWAA